MQNKANNQVIFFKGSFQVCMGILEGKSALQGVNILKNCNI